MKARVKKSIHIFLCIILLLSSFSLPANAQHWAQEKVEKAKERGIIDRLTGETLRLDDSLNRAEAVELINRVFGFTERKATGFVDIQNHRAKEAIEIAFAAGYVKGTSAERFSPEQTLTREQEAVMLYQAFGFAPLKLEQPFKDWDQISDWAKEAVATLTVKQILKGHPSGEFKPKEQLTRAQAISAAVAAEELYQTIAAEQRKLAEQKALEEKAKQKEEAAATQPQLLPLPEESIVNPMRIRQAAEQLFVVSVNEGEELAKVRQDILKNYPGIQAENLHLAKIFKNDRKVLAYIEQTNLSFPALAAPEEVIDGFYALNQEKDFTLLEESAKADRQECLLVVGKPDRTQVISVGRKILGYPQNSLKVGLDLNKETILVRGLNLELEKTPAEALVLNAAIGQSGKASENPGQLVIAQNKIDLGKESEAVKSGIRIRIPVSRQDEALGELRIENNVVIGSGNTKDTSRNAEAISLITRAKENTRVVIKNNHIRDYMFHGIGVTAGKDAYIEVTDNHLENIGQNGMGIFLFDTPKEVNIKGNRLDSFGTKEIKSGAFGTEPKVGAESETGISLEYIDIVYGVKINQKYYSNAALLAHDLAVIDNRVAEKAKNDELDGVFDCTPIYIGQKNKFADPVQALNGRSRLNKKDVIVVKSEDGDLVLGVNPDNPSAQKQVKSLHLTGSGSGRVILSENLEILEDLIIDLPNAMVQNKAKVKGKVQVWNVRENDFSAFRLTMEKNKIFKSNASDIVILVEDIKNQQNQAIGKEASDLTMGVRLLVGQAELAREHYQVLDEEDKILLKKEYLNTLKENTRFLLEYGDPKNQVQSGKKGFEILVEDLSGGKLEFVEARDRTIICAYAPEEGIRIRLKDLKNILGEPIAAEKSNLTGNLQLSVSYQKAEAADFTVNEQEDIITLKKAFLDKVPSPAFGNTQAIRLALTDTVNSIDEIQMQLELEVQNYSVDQGAVTAKNPLTFTEGNALPEGLTFIIKDLKNAKGELLTAAETDLTHYLEVEPFPVDWQLEMMGSGEEIRFDVQHYEIDDVNDTITLKKSYLDKIKSNRKDTEFGVKQYIFKYRDPRYGTEFRSKKILVHIKKQLIPLSAETKITSANFQIEANKIVSGKVELNSSMTVRELISKLERGNPRQSLRVYRPSELPGGELPEQNLYHYKNEYENLENQDILVVTAENGKARAYYMLEFAAAAAEELITQVLDNGIVLQLGGNFIKVNGEQTVERVLNALSYAEGVRRFIRQADGEAAATEVVRENMILRVQKGEKTQDRIIKVVKKPVYRALIVANSDYPGEKSDLAGPVGDAKLMKRVLEAQNFAAGKMRSIMVKENLKKEEFFEALRQAYVGANENDISYFYYSGHGFNQDGVSYLCMVEAALDGANPLGLWVSVDELKAALDQVPGKKVLILDSCNSGGFIGKKALDGSSGATPKPHSGQSREFVETVMNEFKAKAGTPNYLIGEEYKVLAASSENEFSYEDKLEKLGKFTKVLAEAAGENGELKADANADQKVGLEELFEYLDKNVIYTSHIQAYPRQDSFVIFEAPEKAEAESDNVEVSAKENAYQVIIRGEQRMIVSQAVTIDTNMTVGDFLSHILPGDRHQRLSVVRKPQYLGEAEKEKAEADKMERFDFLKVTAQNGKAVKYSVIVKPANSVPTPTPATPAAVELAPDFGGAYQLTADKAAIQSGTKKLSAEVTVGEFLQSVKNHMDYSVIQVRQGEHKKESSEKLAAGDRLYLEKGEKKASYHLQLSLVLEELERPDFNGKYKLSYDEKSILSGSERLTEDVEVSVFLNALANADSYDAVKVIKAYTENEEKQGWEKLENEDKLIVKKGAKQASYRLQVESGSGSIIVVPTP